MTDEPKCPFCGKNDAGCSVYLTSSGNYMWRCEIENYSNNPIEEALKSQLEKAMERIEKLQERIGGWQMFAQRQHAKIEELETFMSNDWEYINYDQCSKDMPCRVCGEVIKYGNTHIHSKLECFEAKHTGQRKG